MLCATEAGSAARSFKGSDCCARRARRGAGGRRVRADLCAQSVRAGADRSEQRAAFQQAAGRHDALDPAGRDAVRPAAAPAKPASIPPARSRRSARQAKPGSPYPMPRAGAVVLRGPPQQASGRPRRRRSLRAPPMPTSTSRRTRHCAARCRPTPIRTSRSACGSAASCCGPRSRSARRRQQSEPDAQRAALELHAGAAGGADQVANGPSTNSARRCAAAISPTTSCRR